MIVTVALNPALDRTVRVEGAVEGGIREVRLVQVEGAGKGLNVARAVHRLNYPVLATGLLAGHIGGYVEDLFLENGIGCRFLKLPGGETRVNTTLVNEQGALIEKTNELGPEVSEVSFVEFGRLLADLISQGDIVVFSGRPALGLREDCYARLITTVKSKGAKAFLDTRGPALAQGVKAMPSLIKPNLVELEDLTGWGLEDFLAVVQGDGEPLGGDVGLVVVSLGAEGAVLVGGEVGAYRAAPPEVTIGSTVAAGDAMLGSLAVSVAGGGDPETMLRRAVAAGTATACEPGSGIFSIKKMEEIEKQVKVERLW